MADNMTENAAKVIKLATEDARRRGHTQLNPAHVLCVLLKDPESLVVHALHRISGDFQELVQACDRLLWTFASQRSVMDTLYPDNVMRAVLNDAEELRKKSEDSKISLTDLFLAICKQRSIRSLLSDSSYNMSQIEEAVKALRANQKVDSQAASSHIEALTKYGRDLIADAEAGKLDPVTGRDEEIRLVIEVLMRRTKNTPILTGEPGVGKTAVAEGLAQRMSAGDVPKVLIGCRIIALDVVMLLSGANCRREFEERFQAVLEEVQQAAGKIILFIDEMHLLIGTGKTNGSMDAAALLKPMLARGDLPCIGATTLDEYRKHIEKDAELERRFQQVSVQEPSPQVATAILRGLKERYAAHHGIEISDAAVVAAVQFSSRYIPTQFLPRKAVDLLDEACSKIRVQMSSQPAEVDRLERKRQSLEAEVQALLKEKDTASCSRLQEAMSELSKVIEELAPLRAQHEAERQMHDYLQAAKLKLQELKQNLDVMEAKHDVEAAADLRFEAIPGVMRQIRKLEERRAEMDKLHKTPMLIESVNADHIAEVVSRQTGIPVSKLAQGERTRLLELEAQLKQRVVGQPEAAEAVAKTVLRSAAKLAQRDQPTGSFLFAGPTGVGKTELAKALAVQLFDSEKHLLRFDMSEYIEPRSLSRLIGTPPGCAGHEKGGKLTEALRRNPYTVLLFDDMEKAHHEVMDVLWELLDNARITDSQGRTVDCSKAVVILTSKLGSEHVEGGIDEGPEALQAAKERTMEAIRSALRPELLNRLDDVVIFEPLSGESLTQVVRLQLNDVVSRLKEQEVNLTITDLAVEHILEESHALELGARSLKRYLERHVVSQLSVMSLQGALPPGSSVTADVLSGKWKCQVSTPDLADAIWHDINRSKSDPNGHRASEALSLDGGSTPLRAS